jgi:transcriptional antiterminator NusG
VIEERANIPSELERGAEAGQADEERPEEVLEEGAEAPSAEKTEEASVEPASLEEGGPEGQELEPPLDEEAQPVSEAEAPVEEAPEAVGEGEPEKAPQEAEDEVEEALEVPEKEEVAAAAETPVEDTSEAEAVEELEEDEEEIEAPHLGPVLSSGPGKEWFVVHTYSGYEAKVKASLEERVNALGLLERITQILVPSEQVVEIKGGKKRISARKFFPGYILVEMELSDDTWYLIKNTPKVTGFLGGGRHPTPLPLEEMEFIIEQMRGEAEKPKPRVLFERGENVRIVDGPFTNFTGVIEEVDEIRGKLRVMVSIFGRATPVEMEFLQVEKV